MAIDCYNADRSRRLGLIRVLLQGAEAEAELPEPLCIQALLTLHDAAELFVVLVSEATNANAKSSSAFLEYWAPIDQQLAPEELGHKMSMKAVSDARRGLKHSGVLPSRAEVQRFARATRAFLEDATSTVFGVAFNSVSLADLVSEENVRGHLKQAEGALADGDVATSLQEARVAVELAIHARVPSSEDLYAYQRWRKEVPRPQFTSAGSWHLGLEKKVGREFGRTWDKLLETVEQTANVVRLLSRGVDYEDYVLFELLTPHVAWFVGRSEPEAAGTVRDDVAVSDAAWCVDFATRTALQLAAKAR